MAVREVGDPSAPPVVLLHGFPTSSLLWARDALLLGSRMRVLAPDLLGYGESDRPAGDLSIPAQAGHVAELLDVLGVDRFAVVGHDLGGAVAQLLALDRPGVEAMVLLDPACFDAWPIAGVRLLQEATPEQESDAVFVEEVVRLALDLGVTKEGRLDPATIEAFAAPWRADLPSFFRAARGVDGVGLVGREEDLSRLDLPVFIVWGEEDPYLPPELGDRLNELIPMSTLALLPGCGHYVTIDAGETVGPLVFEWLRNVWLGDRHAHAEPSGPVPVFLERPPAEAQVPPDGDPDAFGR
jgi:pimeloyl-ACP methyl ester carboxylesterase